MKKAVLCRLPAGRQGSQGFTLIETVVSLVLILIVISSAVYLMKASLEAKSLAAVFYRHLSLAQEKMENVRSLPYELIADSGFDNGSGKISVKQVQSGLLEIQLKLEWDPRRRPIELFTLRAK